MQESSGFRELAGKMSVMQIIRKYGDKFFDCYNEAYKDLDCYIELKGDTRKNVIKPSRSEAGAIRL